MNLITSVRSCISIAIIATLSIAPAYAGQYATPAQIPAQKFAQLPGLSNLMLSPDGTHVAYMFPIKGQQNLIIQPISGGSAVRVPPLDKSEMRWIRWANNDRLVFSVSFVSKRRRTETTETRLISVNKSGDDMQNIVKSAKKPPRMADKVGKHAPSQLQDNVIDWLLDDPQHILISLDEDLDGLDEVRKVNIETGKYTIVRRSMPGVRDWMSDGNGNIKFGYGYADKKLFATFVTSDGKWRQSKNTSWWDQGFRPKAFTDKPDIVYAVGPDVTGARVLKELDLKNNSLGTTLAGDGSRDVGALLRDSHTDKPIGIGVVNKPSGALYFDPIYKSMQDSLEQKMPGAPVRILSASMDKRKVIVGSRGPRNPGTFYFWDRDTNKIEQFGESMPGIDPELMSDVEPIEYAARDGLTIPGYLTFPLNKERKALPTIVLPHGGPHSRDTRRWWFLSQFLSSRGYLVFQPNFRGSTGYGKAFEEAGKNQWGGLMQDDVTDGTQWLIQQGYADPNDISIVGWSYGGYAAAMGTIKTPKLFQRAVSINGVLNLSSIIGHKKKYIAGDYWSKSIGLDGERSKKVSPYHLAKEIDTPMLLIHAKDDVRVPIDQSVDMHRRLKKYGKSADFVSVDFGGHSMNDEQARLTILESIEEFLGAR